MGAALLVFLFGGLVAWYYKEKIQSYFYQKGVQLVVKAALKSNESVMQEAVRSENKLGIENKNNLSNKKHILERRNKGVVQQQSFDLLQRALLASTETEQAEITHEMLKMMNFCQPQTRVSHLAKTMNRKQRRELQKKTKKLAKKQ